jgi:hypothetical protein
MSLPDVGGAILIDLDFFKSKKLVHGKENMIPHSLPHVFILLSCFTQISYGESRR